MDIRELGCCDELFQNGISEWEIAQSGKSRGAVNLSFKKEAALPTVAELYGRSFREARTFDLSDSCSCQFL